MNEEFINNLLALSRMLADDVKRDPEALNKIPFAMRWTIEQLAVSGEVHYEVLKESCGWTRTA